MHIHQSIRLGFGALLVITYGMRLVIIGNGTVEFMRFTVNPFALTALVLLVLAVPETLDRLPFGPTREK